MKKVDFKRGSVHLRGDYGASTYVSVKWGREEYKLLTGSGSRDSVYVARDGDMFYVLSASRSHDYVGVVQFDMRKIEASKKSDRETVYTGDEVVFLQDATEALASELRKPWDEYTDANLLRSLLNIFY